MFAPSSTLASGTSTTWDEFNESSTHYTEDDETDLCDYFSGPQLLITATGNKLLSVDLSTLLPRSAQVPLVSMRIFHGGHSQQWILHCDGNGGAAIMSRANRLYVVPSVPGSIKLERTPYFWDISRDGDMYRFSTEKRHDEQLYLDNKYAKLSSQRDSTTVFSIIPITAVEEQVPLKGRSTKSTESTYSEYSGEDLTSPPQYHQEFSNSTPTLDPSPNNSTGRECTGFPSGFFRIRLVEERDNPRYWTVYREDSRRDGNVLVLSRLNEHSDSQAFYINGNGELCVSGVHVDIFGNCLIVAKPRVPTLPWPNPWSHHLPTFTYSKTTKTIQVKPYLDPLISPSWPRPDKDWQDKVYLVTSKCTSTIRTPSINDVARWTPTYRFVRWTDRFDSWSAQHDDSLGPEEFTANKLAKTATITPRMQWEIEQV